jgi:hypothetical protein
MEKGAVNVAGEWTGGLQEPNGLKRQPLGWPPQVPRSITKGNQCLFTMKLGFETSVWKVNGDPRGSLPQPEPGRR